MEAERLVASSEAHRVADAIRLSVRTLAGISPQSPYVTVHVPEAWIPLLAEELGLLTETILPTAEHPFTLLQATGRLEGVYVGILARGGR